MLVGKQTINKETFNSIIWITLAVFIILIAVSTVKYDSIFETYRIIAPVLLFIMLINLVRKETDWKIGIYSLVGFGLFISIVNYIGFYTGPGFGTYALASIWGYQNTFAAFLVLMIQISLGLFLDETNKNRKMFLSVLPMFFIFLLFLTVSRGGYIAFLVSIVVFLVAMPKSDFKKTLKESIPVIGGAILLIVVGSPKEIIMANLGKSSILVSYIGGEQDYSLGMRVYMLKLAFQVFLKKPIFGFGLGTFRYTYAKYNTADLFFRIDPHSLFFKFLSETGLIGTTAFFSMLGYYLIKSFKIIRSGKQNYTYLGLFAGLTGMLFHMCLDVDIYPIMFVVMFFALALLVRGDFVEFKIKPKLVTAILTIAIILITSFDLAPKAVASIYAVKGENPNSLKKVAISIENLQKATEIDPECSQYYFQLGELYAKSMTSYEDNEKIELMNNAYQKAYELNKFDYRAPFRIGIALLFDRDKESITYLEKSIELCPINPNVISWLSVAYAYVEKDIKNGQLYLDKAQKYGTSSLDVSFPKSVLELARGNKEAAEKEFSTLIFYDEIYKKLDTLPKNYAQGRYNLQLKIIRDMMSEIKEN
jgi:O-antigen ligase